MSESFSVHPVRFDVRSATAFSLNHKDVGMDLGILLFPGLPQASKLGTGELFLCNLQFAVKTCAIETAFAFS